MSVRPKPDTGFDAAGEVVLAPIVRPARLGSHPGLLGDRLFRLTTMVLAAAVLALLVGFAVVLGVQSHLSLAKFGFGFFTSTNWDPVNEEFGALPFIYGTAVSSAIALLIAVPLSLGVALCLVEVLPQWMATRIGFLVELLAAIPSVVYGLWGIFVLGPWIRDSVDPLLERYLGFLPFFKGPHISVSLLTAGVLLSVMVIPYITAVCTEVFRVVPSSQREAALALGATRWEMIRLAVIPYGYSGVVGAIILGLGRALGETIAVAMVIGNRAEIAASLFMPSSTLASAIANEFTEATSDIYLSSLVELGLVLMVLAVILNAAARALVMGVVGGQGERR
ncbi:MAG TPA: phosphate ABC transporter permease subunit PstC [Candidatus Binataceae bacterium]|nr:phosphate ABC transporter permease subunit PstC [Candidatus Binataceae bacterium]